MPNSQQFSATYNSYIPAIVRHQKNNWLIEYYVLNPITCQLERKRIRLNHLRKHCRTVGEFKQIANNIAQTINNRLAGGWSPFGESENIRYYTKLGDAMSAYLKEKEKDLSTDTMRSYKSFCNIFGKWCDKNIPDCKCILFNRVLAVRYMDYVYTERNVSARGYNNQLKMARAFFAWAVERCYCKENPFELIKPKRETEKKRILIPAEERARIKEYFLDRLPGYVVVMEMVFTSLLRPKEISRVRVKQVNLKEHYIYMPSDQTKNGHERYAFLSDELCERLSIMIADAKPDDYLISRGYRCGAERVESIRYRKDWDFMRRAVGIPKEMQLYSLRDTGINNMLKAGIDALTVMQAADHHDLSMTTRYAKHADPNLMRVLQAQAPAF